MVKDKKDIIEDKKGIIVSNGSEAYHFTENGIEDSKGNTLPNPYQDENGNPRVGVSNDGGETFDHAITLPYRPIRSSDFIMKPGLTVQVKIQDVEEISAFVKAVDELLHQIDISDFTDEHGHKLKMNKALHDVLEAVAVCKKS